MKGRLFDLVPAGRLESYLDAVARNSGLFVRLLDELGDTLISSSPGGNGRSEPDCAEAGRKGERMHAWDAPVQYKGERLGTLTFCGVSQARDTAGQLLAVSASHIESMIESGYEVESLSGEVVRVYEELAVIYGLTARLGAIVDVGEICRVVAEEAGKVLCAGDVLVLLAQPEHGLFRTAFALGEHEEAAGGFSPGIEEGLIGAAYVGHRSLMVCEVDEDKRHTGWPYPIRRLLAVPLMAEGNVTGVLVATDKQGGDEFNSREEKLLSAMSSVAAISIRNAQRYTDIKDLLEGFINASVTAVESRDPTTAGHSLRVAMLTVELAKKVDASELPVFKGVSFSFEDLMEMRYAGLLHDFGKIGVSESVLLKPNKLTEDQIERVRTRFAYIRETKRREALEAGLRLLLEGGEGAYREGISAIETALAREMAQIDEYLRLVETANNPRVLLTDIAELGVLAELSGRLYTGPGGERLPYLTRSELENLNVLKGSFNERERKEAESHVTHSFNFLSRVPWSEGFSRIPEIVYAHHERLDGSGYPRGLKAEEIPIQAKMMAVTDTFDALTAWDRPYKDAVSVQKALFILEMGAQGGKLEPHMVQIFRDAAVYKTVEDVLPKRGRGKKEHRNAG